MFKFIVTGIVGLMAGRFVTSLIMGVAQYTAMNAQIAMQTALLRAQIPILRALKTEEAEAAIFAVTRAEAGSAGGVTPFIIGGVAAVAAFAGLSSFTGGGGGGIGEYQSTNNNNSGPAEAEKHITVNTYSTLTIGNNETTALSTNQQKLTPGPLR
jgi:hypothetical protein